MDEWITAIKKVSSKEYYESDPRRNFHMDVQGNHSWYVTNHARPTFCNVFFIRPFWYVTVQIIIFSRDRKGFK